MHPAVRLQRVLASQMQPMQESEMAKLSDPATALGASKQTFSEIKTKRGKRKSL